MVAVALPFVIGPAVGPAAGAAATLVVGGTLKLWQIGRAHGLNSSHVSESRMPSSA